MIPFDLWGESFIFFAVYSVLIIVPCVLVAWIGRDMITRLGKAPTETSVIQMSIVGKLVTIEVITFTLMIVFFRFFSH